MMQRIPISKILLTIKMALIFMVATFTTATAGSYGHGLKEGTGFIAQTISGTISDALGNPLPGISVNLKGTPTGTTTNSQGRYTLTIPDGNGTLVFSGIGFTTQEININGKTIIDVTLVSQSKALNEVVIIGYGTANKRDLTGSVSSISSDQIEKVPVTTLDQALQGRSAGVQVTNNDGSPGAGISIKIRGTGTFGDNSPLYVVDGYPVSGDISSLDPANVASIDILKDASATAIYGNRASNGVVIITTKRGRKDGIQISLSALGSVQAKPEFYKVLNAEQFVTAAQKVAETDNYPILPEWKGANPASFRNIDWQDAFYQTGLKQSYNLALRGGNQQLQSSFTLGYFNQKGIIQFSNFKRYNLGVNLDYTPYKWLKASTSVKYSHSDRQLRRGTGINGLSVLTTRIPTMTGNPLTDQIKDENGNYGYYTKQAQATSGMTNIFADNEEQEQANPFNSLLTTASLEVTLIKGLKVKTNFGVNTREFSGYSFSPSNNRTEPAPTAYYSQNANNSLEWLWENTVAYTRNFGNHDIDFVGGVSAQKNTYRQVGASGNGLVSNEVRNVSSLVTVSPYGNQQSWSLASQFGRLTYKFMDKYIVTGTVRRDGSSRFGAGQKWGVFPSASVAWKLKDEHFLQNVNAISDLKLRGSWGKSGNQNIGLFQYLATYGSGPSLQDNRGYVFGRAPVYYPGLVLNGLPNPELTWEKTTQTDIGMDAAFLDNRITLTIDYYKRVSSDFLLNVNVPSQTGFTSATRNVGSIRNTGLELALGYNENRHAFKWSINANVSTVNNKIISFAEGLKSVGNFSDLSFRNYGANVWTVFSQSQVGGVVGAFYGLKSAGVFQAEKEIVELNDAASAKYGSGTYYQVSSTSPGDRKFVDVNGDGRITDDDRTIIGNPFPDFYGGVNFDGSYKQFDFSVFVYASVGNDILNYARRNLENFDAADGVALQNFGQDFYYNHWTPENYSATYTRLVSHDQNGNDKVSDAYVEDGSYMRLKNVQIGYTLPASAAKKVYLNKVRFYVSAQNLLTLTNYSGLDPEIGEISGPTATGVDMGNYPTSKYFTLGVNVSF